MRGPIGADADFETITSNQKDKTMNEITKIEDDDDGFGGSIANSRLIRGQILRWSDTGGWSDRDGLRPPNELLVLASNEALQRLKSKKVENITDKPLPDPSELNAAIPTAEWEVGIDSKPRPPWAHMAMVYLIDPATAGVFTYLNSTVGAHIAWDVLRERVKTMRALRGERVLPLVRLSTRPMKTKVGMKTRPEFEIIGWRLLGGGGGNVGGGSGPKVIEGPKAIERLPETPPAASESSPAENFPVQKKTPKAADATVSTMEKVSFPSVAEQMDDSIPW
jgi:hypothetical protein